jgi:hypothetical protein
MTLVPGEGPFWANFGGTTMELTFTGTLPTPVYPPPTDCGCGKTNLFRPTDPELGTFESITGSTRSTGPR